MGRFCNWTMILPWPECYHFISTSSRISISTKTFPSIICIFVLKVTYSLEALTLLSKTEKWHFLTHEASVFPIQTNKYFLIEEVFSIQVKKKDQLKILYKY